jgi:hypothetical protein
MYVSPSSAASLSIPVTTSAGPVTPGTASPSLLANTMQKLGAKVYVAVNVSIPITKTAFLARTTDFIVSFNTQCGIVLYKHENSRCLDCSTLYCIVELIQMNAILSSWCIYIYFSSQT